MTKLFRPMLAASLEESELPNLKYPYYATPKIDGVRVIGINGTLLTRSMKPIRNEWLQDQFKKSLFSKYEDIAIEGEVCVTSPTDENVYRYTTSFVNSFDKTPENFSQAYDVKIYIFDIYDQNNNQAFYDRYWKFIQNMDISKDPDVFKNDICTIIDNVIVRNPKDILDAESKYLNEGYEGIMLRHPSGLYKNGRATNREATLFKFKRFMDAEAEIIGFEEEMKNNNEPKFNELMYQERSSSKEGLIGSGVLGSLVCSYSGVVFRIGTGFTDEERAHIWNNQEMYLGKLVKFKFFNKGIKEAPRFPVFLGFRDESDLDLPY